MAREAESKSHLHARHVLADIPPWADGRVWWSGLVNGISAGACPRSTALLLHAWARFRPCALWPPAGLPLPAPPALPLLLEQHVLLVFFSWSVNARDIHPFHVMDGGDIHSDIHMLDGRPFLAVSWLLSTGRRCQEVYVWEVTGNFWLIWDRTNKT